MPIPFILGHLLACSLLIYGMSRGKRPNAAHNTAALLALAAVIVGFYVDRHSDLVWRVMTWFGSGMVYLTNTSLEGVTVLAALMWRMADDRREHIRAVLFSVPLFGVSLWSYVWFFQPIPAGIDGKVDRTGLCLQSTPFSCSAASAAMLLQQHGIVATEEEMARLCLTRAMIGTSPAGLFRGLAVKAAPFGFRPRAIYFRKPEELQRLHQAAIINVGLKPRTDPVIARRMESYGWSTDSGHSVVVFGTDSTGKWIDVGDPTNGKERWPADDLKYIWDGSALVLEK